MYVCTLQKTFPDDTGLLIDEAINIDVFERSRDAFQILITAPLFVNKTVLCFLGHFTLWYYNSDQEKCPGVVSVVFPELISGEEGMVVWQIESQVVLGKDCDYTVSIASHSGAGETNSSGSFSISTRVLIVEVGELEGEVVVRCVFRHTLSQRCYVQLVSSEVEGGFQQGGCVEGEGEGVHRFSGLLPVTYTVLVYGLAVGGGEGSCSPALGDPDFITVATVHGPVTTPVTSQRPFTDETTRSLEFPSSSSPLCAEAGVGVGACMGAVTTSLLFLVGIITVKMLSKHKQRKRKETESSTHSQNTCQWRETWRMSYTNHCQWRETWHMSYTNH
ncbi:hypothetical protein GBAR_LOCUS12880 [Geodia barretti]|uniref:Uncharacterized protein n=1 Tax=Geodia barretti TaxID=519541 RepID=A0AA35S1R9_GEOBA|nr:hypothetical protein GBAR_LOCUS12880 [Geodia barretti]